MKVLVTGGAGFIGSHVVDTYIENGYEVVVVDNLSTGQLSNLNPAATFYNVDIRGPQLSEIFDKERPDYVNHHAAQMDVRRSTVEPLFDAAVNILGSINLIECAQKFHVKRFVYISSGGAVYGEPEYLPCDKPIQLTPSVSMVPASTPWNTIYICITTFMVWIMSFYDMEMFMDLVRTHAGKREWWRSSRDRCYWINRS